uniref:Zasp-like motif domain-containing protein n=1 Tax=Anopheles culicifacies TaxID=139723 RepID=A0A182LZF0_9DIPT
MLHIIALIYSRSLHTHPARQTAGYGRQSRSRQPARPPVSTTTATPCIDRETVLKINRRPLQRRHRSCDNFWPPRSPSSAGENHPHQREPSPAGTDDNRGEFAIDSRRYGSHDSIHFDERIRRQHKIEPLRTLFDKENVVLTDWGQRPQSTPLLQDTQRQRRDKNDNHVYGSDAPGATTGNDPWNTSAGPDNHRALRDDDYPEGCTLPQRPSTPPEEWPTSGLHSNYVPASLTAPTGDYLTETRPEVHPPVPPPRRYYLPMDKIVRGELEAMPRLFQDTTITTGQHHRDPSPVTLGRRSATPSYGGTAQLHLPERSKSVQSQADPERTHPNHPTSLRQDGVESKPPLKLKPSTGRTTPRSGTLQRHQTVTDVSCIEALQHEDVDAVEAYHEFNLNSNTDRNLNIDRYGRDTPSDVTKPPTQSCTNGHSSPTVTCPVSATIPPTAVTIGADQLTTNYFDKHLHHPFDRFPVASARGDTVPNFPLQAGVEIERADHKFDSNVNCTGHRFGALDEFHNYNEKLITDTDSNGTMRVPGSGSTTTPPPVDRRRITENQREPHSSALNVSNQPNRNWINLNSNQIYHQHRPSPRDLVCQRMSPDSTGPGADAYHRNHGDPARPGSDRTPDQEAHVAYGDNDSANHRNANDNLQRRTDQWYQHQQPVRPTDCNYDNKSVRSHYRREASPTDNGPHPVDVPRPRYVTPPSPPLPPYPAGEPSIPWRPRARSGSSGSSVKINEIFEFPPPPPYPCDCADGAGFEDDGEPSCGMTVYRTNVRHGSEGADTSVDTGRDYSTSDRSNRPVVRLSPVNQAATFTASLPTYRPVNPAMLPPPRLSPSCDGYPPTVDLTGGDNDVTGLKHPRPIDPDSCIVPDEARTHRTALPSESLRNVFHPSPPHCSNVDVDYFKTNFTDDKTPDVNANRARNFDEEPNKYDTQTPQDKSIDPDRTSQERAENRTSAPERGTKDTPVQPRMISFTDASTPDDYTRWARFENGNISPPSVENEQTADNRKQLLPIADPTKRRTRGEEIEDIFQQLNHSLKANATRKDTSDADGEDTATRTTLGQLVENVPVIERILDDLLTFSKQLLEQKHYLEAKKSIDDANAQDATVTELNPLDNRGPAPQAEINDDNLINLLPPGNDLDVQEASDDDGRNVPNAKSHNNEPTDRAARGVPGASIEGDEKSANNDANSNQPGDFGGGSSVHEHDDDDCSAQQAQQEDLFTNVAIFNWNPLDVYQQHGLFMIDPRFALADMRAISPVPTSTPLHGPSIHPLPTVPEEMDTGAVANDQTIAIDHAQVPGVSIENQSAKNYNTVVDCEQAGSMEMHTAAANASKTSAPDWKMDACHNYCSPSVDPMATAGSSPAVNYPAGDNVDKIVQMNQVLHFYDSSHVHYPLGRDAPPADNRQQRESAHSPALTAEGTYH